MTVAVMVDEQVDGFEAWATEGPVLGDPEGNADGSILVETAEGRVAVLADAAALKLTAGQRVILGFAAREGHRPGRVILVRNSETGEEALDEGALYKLASQMTFGNMAVAVAIMLATILAYTAARLGGAEFLSYGAALAGVVVFGLWMLIDHLMIVTPRQQALMALVRAHVDIRTRPAPRAEGRPLDEDASFRGRMLRARTDGSLRGGLGARPLSADDTVPGVSRLFRSDVFDGQVRLLALSGPDQGRLFVLPWRESVIGRQDGAEVQIADAESSRRHASIVFTADGMVLRDLGSRNGVGLNGRRAEESALDFGDVIAIGATQLRVTAEALQQTDPEASRRAWQVMLQSRPGFAPAARRLAAMAQGGHRL